MLKEVIMERRIASIEEFTEQIKDWYACDYRGFKTLFDAAVANVQPIPEGQKPKVVYDWRNKGIDDLCRFFADWYNWLPDMENGLDYIQKFSWLYYENNYGLCFVTIGPGYTMTKQFVTLRGEYFDSPNSRVLTKKWIDKFGSLMNQFVTPSEGFQSYNAFFTRRVKPGARPVDAIHDDSIVVSPADCIINMIVDELTEETKIPVKTVYLNVKTLLNNSPYAVRFAGGTAVSCILMPDMYHRYHAPVSGVVLESNEDVAGEYFGIKYFPHLLNKGDVGYGYDYSVFEHFRRGYLVIKTENHGHVGMIPVGLNTVGSVEFVDQLKHVDSDDEPVPITKGDEIGWFKYGGSLNILLFEEGRFPSLSLLQGQRIGVLK